MYFPPSRLAFFEAEPRDRSGLKRPRSVLAYNYQQKKSPVPALRRVLRLGITGGSVYSALPNGVPLVSTLGRLLASSPLPSRLPLLVGSVSFHSVSSRRFSARVIIRSVGGVEGIWMSPSLVSSEMTPGLRVLERIASSGICVSTCGVKLRSPPDLYSPFNLNSTLYCSLPGRGQF